ncbi:Crp/Fnr family transcriptional regulator [Mucilaginibacter robiniae]|uniref:Crp/Fnr family transcriptional regulator n=1 Tax=Mucilaginibacter robiniae TaxID=2728022 RepID=A0A7L5DXG1_9SPHI|nr:Crp/Fnr family transcriptional regulator [Mucilaginibacter robiniae]QJD94699.1 Crp/Fnr family transcriptional regulator [Mucilaginibacter robiniae]
MDKVTAFTVFRKQLKNLVVFNDEEWTIFEQYLQLSTLKKKDHFIKADEVCKQVGFIVSGSVRLYHLKDGEEITGYFCFENEFISSYKSFIQQQPGYAYIQALEDTLLVIFDYKSLQQLLANQITAYKMERFGRLIAEYLICCYEDRVHSFVTQTPEERYAELLNSNAPLLQRVPQHYLANFLGITPVSLSRIRKRMFEPAR